jgi:protein tyrosine/serine phosphatase
MRGRGLVGLGLNSIDVCTWEIKQFFEVLADDNNYPILVHCTQGKDRTGLTILLALLLMETPLEAAEHDYMLSQQELVSERDERVEEILSIGLPENFADCDPHFVLAVFKHIQDTYGGIQAYLEHAGIDKEKYIAVRRNLSP